MDYMFETGFLGTRAPFFMDMITLIVSLLPLLIFGAIRLAQKKSYTLHAFTQMLIFIVSVIVVGYFEYGVRVGGGFSEFMKESNISYTYSLWVLILHIIIATLTLIIWSYTIIIASKNYKNSQFKSSFSKAHKKVGMRTFIGIVLTSFSAIWVYLLMFVY